VKILYFKNVPVNWSCDHFRELILTILKNIQIVRIYKRDNYAFVHFYDRIGAEMALKILESGMAQQILRLCHWGDICQNNKPNRSKSDVSLQCRSFCSFTVNGSK
jgi:hypothetical protein